jgi:hypothetical protein
MQNSSFHGIPEIMNNNFPYFLAYLYTKPETEEFIVLKYILLLTTTTSNNDIRHCNVERRKLVGAQELFNSNMSSTLQLRTAHFQAK